MNNRIYTLGLAALAAFAFASQPAFAGLEQTPSGPENPAGQAAPPDKFINDVIASAAQEGKQVGIGSNSHVAAGERVNGDVVSFMSSTVVDGEAGRDAVSIMGDNTVNGVVDRNAVAVMGNLYVNGHVHRDAVAVNGDVTLGPKAVVDGRVVCVGGAVHRASGATVRRGIENRGSMDRDALNLHFGENNWGPGPHFGRGDWQGLAERYQAWRMRHMIGWGVKVAFSVFVLAIYLLIAVLFPESVRRTGDRFSARPGLAILSAVLGLLALPFACLLLVVTVVGIPVAFLLLFGLAVLMCYGKTCLYALVGRSILGKHVHPALAVFLAAIICIFICWVPIIGILFALILAFLGLACGLSALVGREAAPLPSTSRPPTAASAATPDAPSATAPACPIPAPTSEPAGCAGAEVPPAQPDRAPPSPVSPGPDLMALTALPRAGFWIRIAALVLDALVIGLAFFYTGPWCLLALAAYGAFMWKLKGATIGGIVFGLQVIRLDARPVEWDTAIVRALACFLSTAVLFLGFFWIGFDDEKQAWHDKIAGTIVVRNRKVSLV